MIFVIGLLVALAGCSGDPASYGITGPGVQTTTPGPAINEPDSSPTPGVSTTGTFYGPTDRPQSGPSGFFGYN